MQGTSPDTIAYHLAELRLVGDPGDSRRCVPSFDCTGWDVLDVGCGLGQTLVAPEFSGARSRHGIDVDGSAIELGRTMFPGLVLTTAAAENIPYDDARFDLVFSRVALPYTNVPVALAEMSRVTKPGGTVWLALHSWSMESKVLRDAWRRLAVKRLIDRAYVAANSLLLAVSGQCVARPWSGTFESFQFAGSVARVMRKLSLAEITELTGPHFCISARKAPGK
jgi:ubiquinone/menaquinone biosynthesis C-methylase UbiE